MKKKSTEVSTVKPSDEVQALEATPTERPLRTYHPAVDVLETEDEVTLLVDLPGIHPDDVDLELEAGLLTLTAPAKVPAEERSYLLHEYEPRSYRRSFRVTDSIEAGKIAASFANGVLTLHLPKVPAVKPRRIEVQAG